MSQPSLNVVKVIVHSSNELREIAHSSNGVEDDCAFVEVKSAVVDRSVINLPSSSQGFLISAA